MLDEAHGEVGLGKMKKMLKKMLKRANEEKVCSSLSFSLHLAMFVWLDVHTYIGEGVA